VDTTRPCGALSPALIRMILLLVAVVATSLAAPSTFPDPPPLQRAPSAPPPCEDDPNFWQTGLWLQKPWNFTCRDWDGYACAAGGYGITEPNDIAALVRACPLSCNDGPCSGDSSFSYSGEDQSWSPSSGQADEGASVCACPIEWIDDGECDRQCNEAACSWDGNDCFHSDTGCYQHPTGADYRGNVSHTIDGQPCQYWESQWPNTHDYSVVNYPDSNLGGHNHCRNPNPDDGSQRPWCIVDSFDAVWGYCNVSTPSTTPCPSPRPWSQHNHTELALNEWLHASVY